MTSRFYLTTPIYYATGEPHIGHAYTTFLADTLARYHRQTGSAVHFLTGTDEHGQKVQEEAARRGVEPLDLSDEMALRFRSAWEELDISFDRFIRTTEPDHVAVVEEILTRLHDRGHIYADQYVGWYCVHEERYWTEKDLGPDHSCPDCGRPVRQIQEKNYFFRMSAFQEPLLRHIRENPEWIFPESRRNEVLGFLQKPLGDLSISRPISRISWGVPLPFDPEHITYVWVDALINYVTGSNLFRQTGEGLEESDDSWWPAQLHLLGKDIVTTHAVYWPTLLLAAGLPLPQRLLVHGWWVMGDTKMSKSLGNVVDPLELRERYGTDAVRWYLLREMPTGGDASYDPERFRSRYDELANILGNLMSRTLSMVGKYREGIVPASEARAMDVPIEEAIGQFREAMEAFRVHEALGVAMDLARAGNGYVETTAPWSLARDPNAQQELDETLATLTHLLAALAALLYPVLPGKMEEVARALGLSRPPTLPELRTLQLAGTHVSAPPPLFPRSAHPDD